MSSARPANQQMQVTGSACAPLAEFNIVPAALAPDLCAVGPYVWRGADE